MAVVVVAIGVGGGARTASGRAPVSVPMLVVVAAVKSGSGAK